MNNHMLRVAQLQFMIMQMKQVSQLGYVQKMGVPLLCLKKPLTLKIIHNWHMNISKICLKALNALPFPPISIGTVY